MLLGSTRGEANQGGGAPSRPTPSKWHVMSRPTDSRAAEMAGRPRHLPFVWLLAYLRLSLSPGSLACSLPLPPFAPPPSLSPFVAHLFIFLFHFPVHLTVYSSFSFSALQQKLTHTTGKVRIMFCHYKRCITECLLVPEPRARLCLQRKSHFLLPLSRRLRNHSHKNIATLQ